MSETHLLNVPKYGRVKFRLEFEPKLIKGQLEFPKVIESRRHQRLVTRWMEKITSRIDPDPREFVLTSTIGGRLASLGHEYGGQVIGAYFPQ